MLPPLPTERQLAAELRATRSAFSHPLGGGEYVALTLIYDDVLNLPRRWRVRAVDSEQLQYGREYVPGDGAKFDALAAARRLLFAAREAGFR